MTLLAAASSPAASLAMADSIGPRLFPDVIDERGQFRDDRAIHFVPAAGPRWHAASLDVLHGSAPATCF
jgi:hypothetical protein